MKLFQRPCSFVPDEIDPGFVKALFQAAYDKKPKSIYIRDLPVDQDARRIFDSPSLSTYHPSHGYEVVVGVNTGTQYVGGPSSGMALHTENGDIPSVNYNHGPPKGWVVVHHEGVGILSRHPANHTGKPRCSWLHHKEMYFASPELLDRLGVPVTCFPQKIRDLVVTGPGAVHGV
ncbi:hypothetical protein QAD02_001335 [Eretmocerus hayati]|uniref:Uncharacterized protein n=1 Tax=Eretmocerus hayati TaxID=131215 RepID=A0ACC2NHH5_9HYME|nr:hypothetical protein QAD02_001335 [Eretmocerus hayati]